MLSINLDVGDVVLEDGGDVYLRSGPCQYIFGLCTAIEGDARLTSQADTAMRPCRGAEGATDFGEGALGENTTHDTLAAADLYNYIAGCRDGERGERAYGGTHMSRQVFPQAPSPTITSLRRISAIIVDRRDC